ncbi:hypothetical protein JXD38_03945 [candidate division WOR-3 bacterium]|nr:hypothetical protein [candidate division WOR-3 bacterium]
MRLTVAVLVLAGVAAGAGSRVVSSAPFDQTSPAIAFDGTNFLVTWQDTRDIPTDTSANIYACRLTPSLEVLDTAGILVAGTREEDYIPAVAWGGADYLIAWHRGC